MPFRNELTDQLPSLKNAMDELKKKPMLSLAEIEMFNSLRIVYHLTILAIQNEDVKDALFHIQELLEH